MRPRLRLPRSAGAGSSLRLRRGRGVPSLRNTDPPGKTKPSNRPQKPRRTPGSAIKLTTMSESSAKSSQPLASKGEKDVSEKRGRGRPRKKPQQEPSEAPTPKRPRGRPKGSKNKATTKGRKAAVTPGRKPRGRPKKSV
ncbi:hypothetical protein DV515_00012308 [Chloebia gouldiae]|uniref:High mobility group protein HMG-I/HMG-Y n=1 Tax=Chloebia gouldiae TaxID=44316 RepID=A0A3L8S3R6_CHLGU|nr:hypothetical protein DV515_00012308 [Chloebia gouldiae]